MRESFSWPPSACCGTAGPECSPRRSPVVIYHDGYTIRAGRMTGYVKEDRLVFQENVEVASDRLVLRVPDELVYHVEDGSMSGLGAGILQFRAGGRTAEDEEEGNEA